MVRTCHARHSRARPSGRKTITGLDRSMSSTGDAPGAELFSRAYSLMMANDAHDQCNAPDAGIHFSSKFSPRQWGGRRKPRRAAIVSKRSELVTGTDHVSILGGPSVNFDEIRHVVFRCIAAEWNCISEMTNTTSPKQVRHVFRTAGAHRYL